MKYGVTEKGFRRKTYQECLDDRIARARERYGENVDVSNTSVLGTFIRNAAYDEAELWELAEHVYLSAFVRYAEGSSLDHVGDYITISRLPATKAKGLVVFEGEEGTVIPRGFKVKTEDENIFETVEEVTIKADGKAEVNVQSILSGKAANEPKGAVNEIVNPMMGVSSVKGFEMTGGRDTETDAEFRERYNLSFALGGGSTVRAIRAALLSLPEVTDALVLENVTMEEIEGVPPKSIHCIVVGGSNEDVAEVIYSNKAGGIEPYGNTCEDIEDELGQVHKICFTRAEELLIYVKLKIKKDEGYPGDDVVTRAVINYIGGQDKDGIEYNGLGLGQDVINAKVASSIMCLGGVADIDVELSTDNEEYTTGNIEVGRFETAITDHVKVVIEDV